MGITLKDYLKINFFPKLSYHVSYSTLFENQFYKLTEDLINVYQENKLINFYCRKSQYSEFVDLANAGLLLYKERPINFVSNFEFLQDYSEYFEKGFDSISEITLPSQLINHIPICYPSICLCTEVINQSPKSIPIGRNNSNSKPCLAGRPPASFNLFFGDGLLAYKKFNHVTQVGELSAPNKTAFQQGVTYKSIFLVIERYSEFSEYFDSPISDKPTKQFINQIVKGIHILQQQDVKAECIRLIKEDNKYNEGQFRDWFVTHLSSLYESVHSEPEKGFGRIDLKIVDKKIKTKIIEFKGWWNSDKDQVVNQINNYLTDFEHDGYIILINQNKIKNINQEYLKMIQSEEMNYVNDSLQEIEFDNTGFKYFQTQHNDAIRIKILTHFIINVYQLSIK